MRQPLCEGWNEHGPANSQQAAGRDDQWNIRSVGFGYTVMGRIALLAIRIEFLLDNWLWLNDPTHRRLL